MFKVSAALKILANFCFMTVVDDHLMIMNSLGNVGLYEIGQEGYKQMMLDNVLKIRGETVKKVAYNEKNQRLHVLLSNSIHQVYEIVVGPLLVLEKLPDKKEGNGSKVVNFHLLKDYVMLQESKTKCSFIGKSGTPSPNFDLPFPNCDIQTSVSHNLFTIKIGAEVIVYEVSPLEVTMKSRSQLAGNILIKTTLEGQSLDIASFLNVDDTLGYMTVVNENLVEANRVRIPHGVNVAIVAPNILALTGDSTNIFTFQAYELDKSTISQLTLYKSANFQLGNLTEPQILPNVSKSHVYPIFLCSRGLYTFVFSKERLKPILKFTDDLYYHSLDICKIPSLTVYSYIGGSKNGMMSTGFIACELNSGIVLKTSIPGALLLKTINLTADTTDLLVLYSRSDLRFTSFKTVVNKNDYEMVKEREINYEFEFEITKIFLSGDYVFIIDVSQRLLYSRYVDPCTSLFDEVSFLKTIKEPVLDIVSTDSYTVVVCKESIKFVNSSLEVVCTYPNISYKAFHPYKDILFCSNISHLDVLTPYCFSDLIFNQPERTHNIFGIVEDTLFCYYTFGKNDNPKLGYCSKSFDMAQLAVMNYLAAPEKHTEELIQHLFVHNNKFHFSNNFVDHLLLNAKNHLLMSYYYQHGYMGNLTQAVKLRLAEYLKIDACLPSLINQKKDTVENIELVAKILNTDFTGIYNSSSPLFYSIVKNVDSLIRLATSNSRIKFFLENPELTNLLKPEFSANIAASYQEILDLELKKQAETQGLFSAILSQASVKFGADRYNLAIAQGSESLNLQPYKKENLEQMLHGTTLKSRLLKAQENPTETANNEDNVENLLVYLHPMKNEEELINRVDGQKISFHSKLNLVELDEKEPLEFEDKWGRKIASLFSIKLAKVNFILLDRKVIAPSAATHLNFLQLEIWFFSYYEKDLILFSDSKQQLVVGVRNSKIFINSNKANIYHDKDNKVGYKIRSWLYLSLTVRSNGSVVLEVKNRLLYTGDLGVTAKTLFGSGLFLFPQFEGEVCEVRLWSSERSKAQIEEQKGLPLPKIFEEANSMKIKLKAGKKKKNAEDNTLNALEFANPRDSVIRSSSSIWIPNKP